MHHKKRCRSKSPFLIKTFVISDFESEIHVRHKLIKGFELNVFHEHQ